jgi:alpha,alpha-trehalase
MGGRDVGEFVHALRDFALIADGERGALIGPDGNIVWMCAPQWHDEAVLSRLIGGRGSYAITPADRYTWGGSYRDGTLIWCGRWVADHAIIECHDALALPADPHRAVVLRRIHAINEDAHVRVQLNLRGGFGKRSMREVRRHDDGTWTARTGDLRVRWAGAVDASLDDEGSLVFDLLLLEGATHDLVLEVSDRTLPALEPADRMWDSTRGAWARRVPDMSNTAAPRDARLAAAVLHGLTSAGGGMVAAATMSLPERADHHRSYDYRYAWIRDQCYAGIAAADAGMDDLLDAAVGFVTERVLADGPKLRPAYLIDGGRVPDEHTLHLPGFPGGTDIVGNWVNQQFQLDSLGEALRLLSAAALKDHLNADGWRAMQICTRVISERWDEPDAGIWELDPDWWTQSRLACVAGLRQAAAVAPAGPDTGEMSTLADTIMAKTSATCLHEDGHWQRGPGLRGVDASLVWPAVCGALPGDDPRTVATLEAVMRSLTLERYVYRYSIDDRPLGEAEGSFLLCGFMVAMAQLQQGRRTEALRWFERNRAACGTPGLFSEEYDVQQRQQRGNLPQAFVHAVMLQAALALA